MLVFLVEDLADPKVVENSDIVLIDADLNRVYETFVIARHMRTIAVANNILTVVVKSRNA